jgi:5-methylcytosine-specific restriction endonuclease McrA
MTVKRSPITWTDYSGGDALKECRRCKQWKPLNQFEPRKSARDGKRGQCRECVNARKRAKYVPRGRGQRGHYNMTPEGHQAISQAVRERMNGPSNPNWKGGRGERTWRTSPEYRAWRLAVFQRDRFACTKCGNAEGGNLTAHHIKPAEQYPELRYNLDNGTTLCEECHSQVHGIPVKTSRHKDEETTICACGCGTIMTRWGNRRCTRPRRYLPGHYRYQRGESSVS